MPITAVTRAPDKRKSAQSKVQSIKEIIKTSRRIPPRQELPDALLEEFVKAINDACDNGDLPYRNLRLNEKGSPYKVFTHYMADELFPVYVEMARKQAIKDKISFEESLRTHIEKFIDPRKKGLAFIATNDAKKFWYHVESKILYHETYEQKKISDEDKKMIAKLTKILASGQAETLMRELGKS